MCVHIWKSYRERIRFVCVCVCVWINGLYFGGALFFYTHYLSVFTTCRVWGKKCETKSTNSRKCFK